MPADRDVPPTRLHRWIAAHRRAYRAVSVTAAGATLLYATWMTVRYGLGYWWWIAGGLVFQAWLSWPITDQAARFVAEYDRTHPTACAGAGGPDGDAISPR